MFEDDDTVEFSPSDNGISEYSRRKMREQLQSDVEAFLAMGGEIKQVERKLTSQPPTKPVNNYSSRPI